MVKLLEMQPLRSPHMRWEDNQVLLKYSRCEVVNLSGVNEIHVQVAWFEASNAL